MTGVQTCALPICFPVTIRRQYRIEATYQEHQHILKLIFNRQTTEAMTAIETHIRQSRDEVKKITLHMLDPSQFV